MFSLSLLTVSPSPHIRSDITVSTITRSVVIALLPALVVAWWIFGSRVLLVVLTSVVTTVVVEHIWCMLRRQPSTILDYTAVITGILFAYCLPPSIPLYIVILGAAFAIIFGKLIFGGFPHNPFNPALVGRAFVFASWPVAMTTWLQPLWYKTSVNAVTGATPLAFAKNYTLANMVMGATPTTLTQHGAVSGKPVSYFDLLVGLRGGCIGEISDIALFAGALYLLRKKIIQWHIPLSFILTVGVLSFLTGRDPLFQMLSGGLFLGAFFMATDYATSPLLPVSKIIFGIGCGMITCLIRFKGGYPESGYPEGVCYAILIMNCTVPLLNTYIRPRRKTT